MHIRRAEKSELAELARLCGETRLSCRGRQAGLSCAIGNDRAAGFYEKHGWRLIGKRVISLETSEEPFPLEVWRYEKDVGAALTSPPSR
jgi:hypothetical protein